MQNIEIMPRYSTIYCGKTNIPFGYLAFFRLVIWQSFSSTTKAAAARAAPVAATMTGTTRTGKRNHPTNPPFLLETPLYKGNERRWVGGVQPTFNPPSTHLQPTFNPTCEVKLESSFFKFNGGLMVG
jgi:hypothetical protein